jgi:hypothetical protein
MAENFEILSPFPVIFPDLSGVQLETEPLEFLEKAPEPNHSPEAAAEELDNAFVESLFAIPFSAYINGEIEELEVIEDENDWDEEPEAEENEISELLSGEENTVIAKRDGVPYINEQVLAPDAETVSRLDRNFKNLIDSVLNNNA